jgi:hypothetical protein
VVCACVLFMLMSVPMVLTQCVLTQCVLTQWVSLIGRRHKGAGSLTVLLLYLPLWCPAVC